MKPIVKIICCGAILAWVHSAIAVEADAVPPSTSMNDGIKAYPVRKMDQAGVEKRLEDRAARTRARSEQAMKSKSAQDQQTAPAADQAESPGADEQAAQDQPSAPAADPK